MLFKYLLNKYILNCTLQKIYIFALRKSSINTEISCEGKTCNFSGY